jgi:hypothetical protein
LTDRLLYRSIFAQGIKNFYRLIDQASESHEAIVIAGKRSNVVSISEKIGALFKKRFICCQFQDCVNLLRSQCINLLVKAKNR